MNDHLSLRSLILFDVDGTLAMSTKKVSNDMKDMLRSLKQNYDLAIIGGSAFLQHQYQIGDDIFEIFDYVFSENGVQAFRGGQLFHDNDIRNELGDEFLSEIINFCLRHIADLQLPKKRGRFIDFRKGLIYITPMGNQCTMEERLEYIKFDQETKTRDIFIEALNDKYGNRLNISLGGQIGLGITPKGWDKSYCLQHINLSDYQKVHFFGDQTSETGNDYPLYSHPEIIGHSVTSPEDTLEKLKNIN